MMCIFHQSAGVLAFNVCYICPCVDVSKHTGKAGSFSQHRTNTVTPGSDELQCDLDTESESKEVV